LGGEGAVRSVGGRGAARLNRAPRFKRVDVERIGDDLHYTGRF
jgi:riboflavin biosynthesis pyrimidine reductase